RLTYNGAGEAPSPQPAAIPVLGPRRPAASPLRDPDSRAGAGASIFRAGLAAVVHCLHCLHCLLIP
ncbi:hypothetical protein BO71DRAFT_339100, partial [Aspergillus ellipticus CBS 707.79]